jgi:HSP20 family protein
MERKKYGFDDFDEYFESNANEFHWEKKVECVDVFEVGNELHILAMLPGIEKSDIKLGATKTMLKIRFGYSTEHVHLPSEVSPSSARATYKNSVLEVVFTKK